MIKKNAVLFEELRDDAVLSKLEMYSLWTIPSIFPKGVRVLTSGNNEIEHDYQSSGAIMVNRLATKLARSLFPANTPFFRLEVDKELQRILDVRELEAQEYENEACKRIFLNAAYAQLVYLLRLLIITGNGLVHRVNDSIRVYSLRDYVTKRNNVGEVLDIVLRDYKYYSELDEASRKKLPQHLAHQEEPLEMYTRIVPQDIQGIKSYRVTQEINDILVGSATYPDKLCPYIPVVWNIVNGDNYGRGYVEDYAGDFAKLSILSYNLTNYEIEATDIKHLVNPAGGIDVRSLEEGRTGDYVHGTPDAIQPYEAGSFQKIQTLLADIDRIEARLQMAFMYTGNTREGERITAYEIRQNAEEAEHVLGGVYSQLAHGLHIPLAYLLLNEFSPDIMQSIRDEELTLRILTGIQALSRSSENQGLIVACTELNAVIPVIQQLGRRFNMDAIADKVFLSNGVQIKEITYTEEEVRQMAEAEQAQNQEQQMQAMQQMQQPSQLAGQESAISAIGLAQQM